MELLTRPEPAATLWRRAAPALERALEHARYQAVRIRATQGGLTIGTRTAGRPPTTIRTGHDEAAATLARTGMGEFLNRHTAGGRRRVTQEAAAARARGGTETTILDWQRPPGPGAPARGYSR